MARLAIRATGDRSKRENVTTGDNNVVVYVSEYNTPQWCVEVRHDDDKAVTYYTISEHFFGKWRVKYSTATYWDKSE